MIKVVVVIVIIYLGLRPQVLGPFLIVKLQTVMSHHSSTDCLAGGVWQQERTRASRLLATRANLLLATRTRKTENATANILLMALLISPARSQLNAAFNDH